MDVLKSKRLGELPPYVFMEIAQRIKEVRARGVDLINLAPGIPDGATPAHIVEALARAAADPETHKLAPGAARGLPAYLEATAAWYGRRFGVQLDPASETLALIGSKEGNHHLALGLLDPGDLALVPDPAYPAYEASVVLAGARSLRLPLLAANDFLVDFDAIPQMDAIAAKVVWLSYPNNPTTAVAPLEFFQRAVDFAHRYNVLLVNDNPYSEISFDGVTAPSILQVDGAKDVAIEFNSLSKTYNMTGWRIGMAVGNPAALDALAQVKENTDTGLFTAVQHAGVAALDGPQTIISENKATYQRRRDRVVPALRSMGFDVELPKATIYAWVKLPDGAKSSSFASRLLDLTGVVVTPGLGFGVHGDGYVRVSLATPDDRLDEAMRRIESVADQVLDHKDS